MHLCKKPIFVVYYYEYQKHTTMTVLYIRVSSEGQNIDRQEKALKDWATKTGSTKTTTIVEKISGSVSTSDRQFNRIFKMKEVVRVVVQDIDRLGRDTIDILQTIKKLTAKGINVTVTALGMDTLLPNGKVNESFKIVLSVMATLAEMERTKLKERQRQGIEIAKKQGKYKGRAKGATKSVNKLLEENKKVVKELKKDKPLSLRKIALIGQCSVNTVQKIKATIKELETA